VIPTDRGQRSGDRGQLPMSAYTNPLSV
jgi:hypothetical protein